MKIRVNNTSSCLTISLRITKSGLKKNTRKEESNEAQKADSDNSISRLLAGIKGNLETALEYSGGLTLSVETSHQVSSSTNTVTLFHYLHVKLSTELNTR